MARCEAMTVAQTRCKRNAASGEKVCKQHLGAAPKKASPKKASPKKAKPKKAAGANTLAAIMKEITSGKYFREIIRRVGQPKFDALLKSKDPYGEIDFGEDRWNTIQGQLQLYTDLIIPNYAEMENSAGIRAYYALVLKTPRAQQQLKALIEKHMKLKKDAIDQFIADNTSKVSPIEWQDIAAFYLKTATNGMWYDFWGLLAPIDYLTIDETTPRTEILTIAARRHRPQMLRDRVDRDRRMAAGLPERYEGEYEEAEDDAAIDEEYEELTKFD